MKSSSKDIVEGKFHQAKGAVKEAAGEPLTIANLKIQGNLKKQRGRFKRK